VHPNGIHARYRIAALHEEAARHRLQRRARVRPEVEGGGDRIGRVLRPVRAVAMGVGLVLVRIGVALGAPPMDNA
jgi:hypothetical protein